MKLTIGWRIREIILFINMGRLYCLAWYCRHGSTGPGLLQTHSVLREISSRSNEVIVITRDLTHRCSRRVAPPSARFPLATYSLKAVKIWGGWNRISYRVEKHTHVYEYRWIYFRKPLKKIRVWTFGTELVTDDQIYKFSMFKSWWFPQSSAGSDLVIILCSQCSSPFLSIYLSN